MSDQPTPAPPERPDGDAAPTSGSQERSGDADAKPRRRTPGLTQALTNDVLAAQARTALERRLATNPRDPAALLSFGRVLRREGEFRQAIATYRTLHTVQPDATIAWLIAAISGARQPENPPEGHRATPFVRLENFLSAEEQERLRIAWESEDDAYNPAKVTQKNKSVVAADSRTALESERPLVRKVRPWFLPKLRAVLADVATRLGVQCFDERNVEVTITATLSGGFFTAHQDNGVRPDDPSYTRTISYVYYFHREPKAFAGGELLLYDTCFDAERAGFSSIAFSRIEPVRNTLVLFPSDYFHEILPVHGDSGLLQDARFTVNGWVHRDDPDAVSQEEEASGAEVPGTHWRRATANAFLFPVPVFPFPSPSPSPS